jgi:hypothetical protein
LSLLNRKQRGRTRRGRSAGGGRPTRRAGGDRSSSRKSGDDDDGDCVVVMRVLRFFFLSLSVIINWSKTRERKSEDTRAVNNE